MLKPIRKSLGGSTLNVVVSVLDMSPPKLAAVARKVVADLEFVRKFIHKQNRFHEVDFIGSFSQRINNSMYALVGGFLQLTFPNTNHPPSCFS